MAYFPNGSAGEVLDAQCATCPIGKHGDAPCPVLLAQGFYNYDQFTDGKPNTVAEVLNTLINEEGVCQMKPVIEQYAIGPQNERQIATGGTVIPSMREWAKAHGVL